MEVGAKQVAEATIEATIIRADGSVEHLGIIDSYRAPLWRRVLNKFKR